MALELADEDMDGVTSVDAARGGGARTQGRPFQMMIFIMDNNIMKEIDARMDRRLRRNACDRMNGFTHGSHSRRDCVQMMEGRGRGEESIQEGADQITPK